MSLAETKVAARKAAFARRKAAHADAATGTAARAQLMAALEGARGEVIAGYMPIYSEVDPLPVMTALAASNRIAVPVIEGKGRPLRFALWSPGCALVEGAFGAMIPAQIKELTPTVVIAPLVAFDAQAYRLGYGGGFYDRTLAQLRGAGPIRALGFAYASQQDDALPLEPTDQRLDGVITEKGLIGAQR